MLGYLDEVPVCTAYEVNGTRSERFPVSAELDRAQPVWERLPGWRCDVSAARHFGELPANAQRYVLRLEEWVGVAVKWISVGPERSQVITR